MKAKINISIVLLALSLSACVDLTEKMYDRIDAESFYQNEQSIKSALASIYNTAAYGYLENFWYLNEFSADQIVWRSWNGGGWGYDEGEKLVLSIHTWTPESKIIRTAWENSWTTIGYCNQLQYDLEGLDANDLGITDTKKQEYIAEVRTLRAWAYYNVFEVWGGVIPLNMTRTTELLGSADEDFDKGCKLVYDAIMTELDESLEFLPAEDGSNKTKNRMNQGVNRIIKARMLLNAEVFIKEQHYEECETLCKQILNGDYGVYQLEDDFRRLFAIDNNTSQEVVFAFSEEVGKLNTGWMRVMPFMAYNCWEYFGGTYDQDPWNCCCVAPSYDNSANILQNGNPKSFLSDQYGDRLGAVYERFSDKDIRKQNYIYDSETGWNGGIFLRGAMKANYGTGEPIKADADRDGQDLVYVDQIGTFQNEAGHYLETVMSPRWGETNSGIRLVKYPVYPASKGIDFRDADEVEFRLAEVYYMIAECEMRKGGDAAQWVDQVRWRYFDGAIQEVTGFTVNTPEWMLSEWGKEFLCEGRRRRTDLRRFDKFTQGQWWFFGRTSEDGRSIPAQRDRKYEWFPLPSSAITVNPLLTQNPNY